MKTLFVIVDAIRCPNGTTAICAEIAVTESGSRRNPKNWFKKERRTQASVPNVHVLKVNTGSDGSSVTGTVKATCSIGEFSPLDLVASEFLTESQRISKTKRVIFVFVRKEEEEEHDYDCSNKV